MAFSEAFHPVEFHIHLIILVVWLLLISGDSERGVFFIDLLLPQKNKAAASKEKERKVNWWMLNNIDKIYILLNLRENI